MYSSFKILLLASLLFFVACTDKSDAEESADVGVDVGESSQEMPSVESINFEGAEPGSPARTHIASSSRRGVVSANAPLETTAFLPTEDATAFLGTESLSSSSLAGQSASENYNSIRYAPADEPETFGLALQIWKHDEASTSERLEDLRSQFLSVDDPRHSDAPEGSFTSRRAGIRTFVFPAEDHSHIFALSCDTTTCLDWTDLYEMGIDIASR